MQNSYIYERGSITLDFTLGSDIQVLVDGQTPLLVPIHAKEQLENYLTACMVHAPVIKEGMYCCNQKEYSFHSVRKITEMVWPLCCTSESVINALEQIKEHASFEPNYERFLPYLFKTEHLMPVINWMTSVQDEKTVPEVEDLRIGDTPKCPITRVDGRRVWNSSTEPVIHNGRPLREGSYIAIFGSKTVTIKDAFDNTAYTVEMEIALRGLGPYEKTVYVKEGWILELM